MLTKFNIYNYFKIYCDISNTEMVNSFIHIKIKTVFSKCLNNTTHPS